MADRTTRTGRTPDRAEFLTDIVTAAANGGIAYWSRVHAYRAVRPDVDNADAADASMTVVDTADGTEYPITLDDIERALDAIRAGGIRDWDDRGESRLLVRDADATNDAGDIDAELADAIVQVAVFGEPIYTGLLPVPEWRDRTIDDLTDDPPARGASRSANLASCKRRRAITATPGTAGRRRRPALPPPHRPAR